MVTAQVKGDMLTFVMAGKSIFTLKNTETKNRFTYRIRICDDNENLAFVSVLVGTDNWTNYKFFATLFKNDHGVWNYRYSVKSSKISDKAQSVRSFSWFWRHMDNLPENVQVWHEGKCARCARKLTVPESIESGFGPECIKYV